MIRPCNGEQESIARSRPTVFREQSREAAGGHRPPGPSRYYERGAVQVRRVSTARRVALPETGKVQ